MFQSRFVAYLDSISAYICTVLISIPSSVVELTLDKDAEMDDDHLLVKIKVQELDRIPWNNSEVFEFLWKSFDVSTDDHNDARLSWKLVIPNVLGRGESGLGESLCPYSTNR